MTLKSSAIVIKQVTPHAAESPPPLNRRKRGPTPGSDDDGDSVSSSTSLDDETPPPPQRSLVRELVESSSDTTNTPTYQASLPQLLDSQTKDLPGQISPTAEGKKRRTKHDQQFSARTGLFRLQKYNHESLSTQNNNPPLQLGQGPYHSSYRVNEKATSRTRGPSSRKLEKQLTRPLRVRYPTFLMRIFSRWPALFCILQCRLIL
ncbi:hypothetical protein AX15_000186 [Amanita polypyramis BW_CC]|nr:hypothetical protein AX15_000186 [Amanita polypyramis BW_CC]